MLFSQCQIQRIDPFAGDKTLKSIISLANIYKELKDDLGVPIPPTGNLTAWAEQGVLLLNSVLTVEQSKANSHKNQGWELFTDKNLATKRAGQGINPMLWDEIIGTTATKDYVEDAVI